MADGSIIRVRCCAARVRRIRSCTSVIVPVRQGETRFVWVGRWRGRVDEIMNPITNRAWWPSSVISRGWVRWSLALIHRCGCNAQPLCVGLASRACENIERAPRLSTDIKAGTSLTMRHWRASRSGQTYKAPPVHPLCFDVQPDSRILRCLSLGSPTRIVSHSVITRVASSARDFVALLTHQTTRCIARRAQTRCSSRPLETCG